MGRFVYALCTMTSAACVFLLLRSYFYNKTRLLLWTCFCFGMLAVNNILLFVDLVILPQVDLSLWRGLSALGAVSLLLFGFVWDVL